MKEVHRSNERPGNGGRAGASDADSCSNQAAATQKGQSRPLAEMSQQERRARYGDFNRKVKVIFEGDRVRVDMDDYMAHPRVRFTIDFIEENWDRIRHNPA